MFKLFKKKSKIEKLQKQYEQLTERSFRLSQTNRAESDKVFAEAQNVLTEIDVLLKK